LLSDTRRVFPFSLFSLLLVGRARACLFVCRPPSGGARPGDPLLRTAVAAGRARVPFVCRADVAEEGGSRTAAAARRAGALFRPLSDAHANRYLRLLPTQPQLLPNDQRNNGAAITPSPSPPSRREMMTTATAPTTATATAAPMATPAPQQQQQQPPAPQASTLQRLNTGDRTNAVRLVAMADRSLAGPVASLFVGAAFGQSAMGGGGAASTRRGIGSGSGSGSGSADASPTHVSGSGNGGVRFTTTRTEDAMDSVLPTAAEDLLSRAVLAPAARFAAHKLSFDLTSSAARK
jgi:hypothetical protein